MNKCLLIVLLVSLTHFYIEGSPMPQGDDDEEYEGNDEETAKASGGNGSTSKNQQKVAEILNGIQVNANEPLKSKLVVEFEAFKDRVITMSSNAKNISRIVQLKCLESLSGHVELFVEDAVMRYDYCKSGGHWGQCMSVVMKDFAYQLNKVSESLRPCITGTNVKPEKETKSKKKPREKQENAADTTKKVMGIFNNIQINATEPLKGRLINELQAMELKILDKVINIENFSKIKNCFDKLDESVQKYANDAEKQYCRGTCINTVTSDFKSNLTDFANQLSPCLQKGLN